MEGVTDAPMRQLLSEIGGIDYCVTEFLRVTSQVYRPFVFRRHMPELDSPLEVATQLQLLGGSPQFVSENAKVAAGLGAPAIDLNFGCPAPTVNRHDGGASLLKDPARLAEIVRRTREAVPRSIPISAKLRLGWDSCKDILITAPAALEAGADWLTIHARTKTQGYAPPAHWSWIAEICASTQKPVIANGDISTCEDFLRCQEVTGAKHFMIGRGLLANPILGIQIKSALSGKPVPPDFSSHPLAWWALLTVFVHLATGHFENANYLTSRMKQWLRFAQLKKQNNLFSEIKGFKTYQEILHHLARAGGAGALRGDRLLNQVLCDFGLGHLEVEPLPNVVFKTQTMHEVVESFV